MKPSLMPPRWGYFQTRATGRNTLAHKFIAYIPGGPRWVSVCGKRPYADDVTPLTQAEIDSAKSGVCEVCQSSGNSQPVRRS